MKNELRIVFMGTPDFAVATLEALLDHQLNVVGVVTAPDKPAGRGQKLQESAVKTFAKAKGLHIMQPPNLKSETFIEELKALEANLQIVVAFRMLPAVVWKQPKYGTFNLHASLLPDYRGAAPIHWAIINGETTTGVTTFFIDDTIDTGAIILQKEVSIGTDETVGNLYNRLMTIGSHLVLETITLIANETVSTTIQPKNKPLKTAYKLNRDNCKIDWSEPLDNIYNKIRGLNPYPTAWCYFYNNDNTQTVKLFKVDKEQAEHKDLVGQLSVVKDALKVSVEGGYLIIKELQLPGKRKMDVKSLLNGLHLSKDSKML